MTGAACIERLVTHARDPGLVMLLVEGRRIGPVRRDDAERAGATPGSRWTVALAARVQCMADAVGCRADALRRLGRRDMPRALLVQRLTSRWGADLAEQVAAALQRDGWIDDAAYASRRASALQSRRPMSAERVQQHLEAEGVTASRARKAATESRDPQALHQAIVRWRRQGRDATWMLRALGRQGFDFDTIQSALVRAGIPCDLDD